MASRKAGAHALRQKRRHQVRGIARQKHAADPPASYDLRCEFIGCDADQFEIVRRTAFRPGEPLPDVFRLHRFRIRLVGKDHERPAPVLRAHLHRHAGLSGSQNWRRRRQVRTRRPLHLGVDDQPILIEAEELVFQAERANAQSCYRRRADGKAPLDRRRTPSSFSAVT